MLPQKQAEEAMVSSFNLTEHDEREEEKTDEPGVGLKNLLWHGGSVYDAWFSCASNQVRRQKHTNFQFLSWIYTSIAPVVLSETD